MWPGHALLRGAPKDESLLTSGFKLEAPASLHFMLHLTH